MAAQASGTARSQRHGVHRRRSRIHSAGYLGLTIMLPMIVAGLVTFVCAFVFVVAVGLGVQQRWLYGAVVFAITAGVVRLLRWAAIATRRGRVPRLVTLLGVGARQLDTAAVGTKAGMLARLAAAGVRVPPSWVLTAAAFRVYATANGIAGEPAGSAATAGKVRGGHVPAGLLDPLVRLLESTPYASFVVRSSFEDEDGGGRAFAGVYESVVWERHRGAAALEDALRQVWASYWSPRALAYGDRPAGVTAGECRLAILVCARIAHTSCGFASSADVATGYREHHLIDGRRDDDRAWTYRHDVLAGRLELVQGERDGDGAIALDASALAAEAETLTGVPMEVEWGHADGRLWAYQARPLTSLPRVSTLTNSHVVELPRRPLTALSRWFLFGTEPPARLFDRALVRLGLPRLGDAAITLHQGALWLRVDACKRHLAGPRGLGFGPVAAARAIPVLVAATLRAGRSISVPRAVPREPRPAGGSPADLLRAMGRLRQRRLVPLVVREMLVLQLAAVAEHLVARAWRDGGAPAPAIGRHVAPAAWYHCENDAELAVPRCGELTATPTLLEPGSRAAPAPSRRTSRGLRRRVLVRMRDGLLLERERLKARIAVTNAEARGLARALSGVLAADIPRWQEDDVFHLTGAELAHHLAGTITAAELRARAQRARTAYEGWPRLGVPAVVHLDGDGRAVAIAARDGARDVLASGVPLGNGRAAGPALLVSGKIALQPADARARVVVLPDPDIRWEPFLGGAAAVVFLRGGPLSHLAILCREHGVPAVAAADIGALVGDGECIEVDGDRGEVRRVG